MKVIWDEPKRFANLAKHGLDFAEPTFELFLKAIILPGKKGRSKAVGRLQGGTIVVIFAVLGTEALAVISMRPARRDERSLI